MFQNLAFPNSITSRTYYEILQSISHYNDESVEPTSSTEAIFDIIGTFGTI